MVLLLRKTKINLWVILLIIIYLGGSTTLEDEEQQIDDKGASCSLISLVPAIVTQAGSIALENEL